MATNGRRDQFPRVAVKITRVDASLYRWIGATDTSDTNWTTPLSALDTDADSRDPFRFHSWLVVEVHTDEGCIGIGNAGLSPEVGQTIIVSRLARQLLGENSLNTTFLYEKLYRSSLPFGRGGATMAAISALDIALWDIKGLHSGLPVFSLMGGRTKPAIPAYYSRLYAQDEDALAEEARACVAEGFRALKLRFGYPLRDGVNGLRRNVGLVRAVREAVGDDVEVAADAYMGFDVPYAKRLLRELEPYNLRWVEELLPPEDLRGFAELRRNTDIPISGGEHVYSAQHFARIIEVDALDILQFDTNRVGGFTEAGRICTLAELSGLEVIPHGGQMHNLHVAMSSVASPMAEYFPKTPVEVGNELFWYIFDGEAAAVDGTLQLEDDRPGVGLTLAVDHLDDFEIDRVTVR